MVKLKQVYQNTGPYCFVLTKQATLKFKSDFNITQVNVTSGYYWIVQSRLESNLEDWI